jgi:hypothetical protein
VQHLPHSPLHFGLESVQPNFDIISLRELVPQERLAEFDASLAASAAGVDSPVLAPGMSIGGSVGVGGDVGVVAAAAVPTV